MTEDEIRSMDAGPEMDRLLAEKVMGWHWTKGDGLGGWLSAPGDSFSVAAYYWSPSTSIADAWEVVEKMQSQDPELEPEEDPEWSLTLCRRWPSPADVYDFRWHAEFRACELVEDHRNCVSYCVECFAVEAPLAICQAALLATASTKPQTTAEPTAEQPEYPTEESTPLEGESK